MSATQVDLDAVEFRKDLFARLGDWVLRIPPLAERPADVLTLFDHFVSEELGCERGYTAELAEALLLHDWPLNARELRQLARRLATVDRTGRWDLPQLPDALQRPVRVREALDKGEPNRAALEEALRRAKGNVSKAAEALEKDRKSVYRWMKRWAIDPKQFR